MKNINGYFYSDGKPITKQDAISLCANLGEVIIKPSLTARGKGVAKHNLENGISRVQGISIDKIFEEYKKTRNVIFNLYLKSAQIKYTLCFF